jgi:DNA-binding response OmpR family regulator
MTERILVVEDEVSIRETIAYNLSREGFQVEQAADGNVAIEIARTTKPDALILDIMLPGKDGVEVCRILRKESNVPILMLTARADEIDKIVGLEIGADDYMVKPFSMRELMTRTKALLRRVRLMREESSDSSLLQLEFGNLKINPASHEVLVNDRPVELRPKAFDLLAFLASHRGQVFSREQLLTEIWGWDYFGESRTVDVHIRWIREAIEPDPSKPVRIMTIHGIGYRFDG